MDIIKGFPATSQDNYPLNVTTIIKHAARSFGPRKLSAKGWTEAFLLTPMLKPISA
jgi:hypothetical protein